MDRWRGSCTFSPSFRSSLSLSLSAGAVDADATNSRSIQHLRDLRAFFGTSFKIKPLPTLSTGVVAPVVALLSRRIQSESGSDEEEADEELESETKHRNEVYAVEQYVLSCVGTGYTNTARKT